MVGFLGLAREEGTEGDIVRTRFTRLEREVARSMAGYADLRLTAKFLTSLANIAIALTQMHAIRPEALRERDGIVDDKRDFMRGADLLERFRQGRSLVLVKPLHAELEGSDHAPACRERAFEAGWEISRHVERRNQVQLGGNFIVHRGALSLGRTFVTHSAMRKRIGFYFPKMIRPIAFMLLAVPLASCAVVPDAPIVSGTPLPEGSAVKLDQPVYLGDIVVTPKRVVEDSRCAENARCVWAGRLVVETRIDGAGWRDTANITLGETYGTHGHVIALVSGQPEKRQDRETQPSEYRFVYERR